MPRDEVDSRSDSVSFVVMYIRSHPFPPAMITGCSCIRPVSKTNRCHIYQQFKAAGRDCRCPVGFLRETPPSICHCGRVRTVPTPMSIWTRSKDRRRSMSPVTHAECHARTRVTSSSYVATWRKISLRSPIHLHFHPNLIRLPAESCLSSPPPAPPPISPK